MFDKLQQLKELKKMRDEAMAIQRALDQEVVEVEKRGVKVKVTLEAFLKFSPYHS